MCGILLAGVSPLLYEPSIVGSVEYAVVPTPVYVVAGFVSNYVVRQIALREEARSSSRRWSCAPRSRAFYERVCEDLARCSEKELEVTLRLSAGAVGYKKGAEGAEDFLKAADRAMYEAKRRGKARIFVSAVS